MQCRLVSPEFCTVSELKPAAPIGIRLTSRLHMGCLPWRIMGMAEIRRSSAHVSSAQRVTAPRERLQTAVLADPTLGNLTPEDSL